MMELKIDREGDNEVVTFTTPETYVMGENFAEAAARGSFERIKAASSSSRSKFYFATAVATMVALRGQYNAQLMQGRFCEFPDAAWVEVWFQERAYIINPVESRDICLSKDMLRILPEDARPVARRACNYHRLASLPIVRDITKMMMTAEGSQSLLPTIAAIRMSFV